MSLEQKFFRGDYRAVLASSIDSKKPEFSPKDTGWVIGALSFLGRLDEAELLFQSRKKAATRHELVQARFFLGVALSRQSQYDKSRHFFGLNLREKVRKLPPEPRFFALQGLAFNRYFSGRFMAAARASEQAFAAAMEGDFLFGKVLAADIRGHILIHLGEVASGLRMLRQAQEWAELLGNKAASDAIQISVLTYHAQFGLKPKNILKLLVTALKRLSPQDTYSKPNLLLELARQHLLRAQISKAYECLDSAAEIIYSTQNRRQEVMLNHRYGYLHHLSGEPSRALNFIRSARKSLNPAVDRALETEVLGLETKIYSELKKTEFEGIGKAKLLKLSQVYGGAISKKILQREANTESDMRTGADPLGELLDSISVAPENAVEDILETGYLSFLHEALNVPRSAAMIYLELVPGSVTLFDRGQVSHAQGMTPLLRSIAIQLARGEGSKKKLVEKIWGNTYHPLRHDSVVYSAITSFRKLLGERASWIETTEEGYRFRGDLRVEFHQSQEAQPDRKSDDVREADTNLNLRQLKVLKYLSENESLDARTLKKVFRVSEITATRDLAHLTALQLVIRVGRGRATRYLLPGTLKRLSRKV